MTAIIAVIGIIGAILLGFEALAPGIHFPWHESALAPLAQIGAVGWAVWHFVFWKPYCRHEDSSELHAEQLQVLTEANAAALSARDATIAGHVERARAKFVFGDSHNPYTYPLPAVTGGQAFAVNVRNDATFQGVDDCIGHLIRITEVSTARFAEFVHRLPLADARDHDPAGITMSAGVPHLLPILVIHAATPPTVVMIPTVGMSLQNVRFMDGDLIFSNRGEYEIVVGVSGSGVPLTPTTLRFFWRGDAATSRLILA